MPELIACPNCGYKVQMAESLLGRRVRCAICESHFVATLSAEVPPPRPAKPDRPAARKPGPRPADPDEPNLPFCPGCGKPVTWEAVRCPFCGEEFDVANELAPKIRRPGGPLRRDCNPHRGSLIANMGNISLVLGGLSVCLCGTSAVISVPLGIITWIMASQDLERMRLGQVDLHGKDLTETGRTGGILGIVLGLIFASCYVIWWLGW